MQEITKILDAAGAGDKDAANVLIPLVYDELRALAAHRMSMESPGQTLQATALVHEAYLRLLHAENPSWKNRSFFFAAAAEAMRRILIENARRKASQKRGGNWLRVDIQEIDRNIDDQSEFLIRVNEALEKLEMHDPEAAELMKLRYFGGLSQSECAQVLGLSERTVRRRWAYAKAWLYEEVQQDS